MTTIRLEPELITRLDRAAARLSEAAAGVEVTRASVLRRALELGLDQIEGDGPKRRRG